MNTDLPATRTPRRPSWCLPLALVGLTLGSSPVAAPARTPPAPWYQTALVGAEIGPTPAQSGIEPNDRLYASRFDGRDLIRRSQEAHADYVVVWARDGEYAYYDSKLMPKCPGLGDRDVLREAILEAAVHKLPVIAYCTVQYDAQALRQHPEWGMRDAEGKPINLLCFNSGYRDYLKPVLTELLGYGITGLHLDMIDQGFGPPIGCWCTNCQSGFEAAYHKPMPKGVTWDEDWDRMLEFRYQTSDRLQRDLREHARTVNPKVSVDFNYHGAPPFSWEVGQRPVQHAGHGEFITGETGTWAFGALSVGLNARFYAAATPGLPFQVAMQRGVRNYHDQTTRPLEDLRWELLSLLAHGAFVTLIDKTAYDGRLDPVAYKRMGELFKEARAKRIYFQGNRLAEIGLYYSARTRDWYGRDTPARYQQSFLGAHRAMVLEHIPFSVLLDENATLESLKPCPVVCLPNAAILSTNEVALLRRYVEEGGQLIVTGLSGLLGPRGEPLTNSMLAEIIGAHSVRRLDSADNHVRFPAAAGGELRALHNGLPLDWPFLVEGPAVVLQPTTATPVGELLQPHRSPRQKEKGEHQERPASAEVPVGPALLVNALGRGRVVTFATSPDFATGGEYALTETRRLLRNAVRFLHPNPEVEVRAPSTVEAVVIDDPARRILQIHLLALSTPPAATPARNRPYIYPSPMEDQPMYQATLLIRRPFRHVIAWNDATTLRTSVRRVEVSVQNVHEIVMVHY